MKVAPALILIALGLCLSGCRNPASSTIQESGSSPAKTGSIKAIIGTGTLSSGKASKTIVPPVVGSVASVVVTATSGTTILNQTINGPSGTATFAGLASGSSWSLSATAYNSAGTAVGSGSAASPVTIGPNPSSVALAIAYTGSGTTGDLNITLSWPVSTGVDYLSWSLSSGDSSAVDFHSSTPTGANWSLPIIVTGLSPGSKTLVLAFKKGGSNGTPAGNFVEAVNIIAGQTSSCWIDGGGAVKSGPMTMDPSLFFNSNATLASLSFAGATVSPAYSPTVTKYYFTNQSSTFSFSLAAGDPNQTISYTWSGAAGSWDSTSTATQKSASSLAIAATNTNNLAINVTAPDGITKTTYSFLYPYIAGPAALAAIANDLSGSYTLTADIATSGTWTPIGIQDWSNGFKGTLNGNGHTITIASMSDQSFAGLFASIDAGGLVENLHVTGNITNSGGYYIGLLAGFNQGTIKNCSSSGSISAPNSAGVGGLVGENGYGIIGAGEVSISGCYSTADVSGSFEIGGLVGCLGDGTGTPYPSVVNCYARGKVTANVGGAGGLAGDLRPNGRIVNSYAASASVTGAVPGGLVGSDIQGAGGTATNSYYDSSLFTGASNGFGSGLTTSQMQSDSNYVGWDFAGVWGQSSTINNDYPYIRYCTPIPGNQTSLTISFDISGMQGLTFNPATAIFPRGSLVTISCANSTLASGGTNWQWYKDGAHDVGQTGSTYSWATGSTVSLGQHIISCLVDYNGITYSGQLVLTIED